MTALEARRIVRTHYSLNRPVTAAELQAELDMLRRRVVSGDGLFDRMERLAAALWPYAGAYISGRSNRVGA